MSIASNDEKSNIMDIFRHENDSVDLLLQELNHNGLAQLSLGPDDSSPAGSPVKPLLYHTQEVSKTSGNSEGHSTTVTHHQHLQESSRKDFNSSSDTYVSDNDVGNTSHFSNGNSGEAGNISQAKESGIAPSPSKSIMKSSVASGSPKKSVVFQPSLDTFHTYTPKDTEATPTSELATFINHSWQEVDHSATSQDSSSSPPAPPPHSSSTITGLLTTSRDSSAIDDIDDFEGSTHLAAFKTSDKNSSTLSLNEKLNVFLASSSRPSNDDLDQHLHQLEEAKKEETNVNIHRLSYHLEDYNLSPSENPFNALTKSSELYINSAHSSQSSLQSLMDSNRQLEADTVEKTSRGIQFNDGIKGFSDPVATSLIPLTGADEDSLSESSSVGSQFSISQMKKESKQTLEPSYDQSYNSTEKSILNMLNTQSQTGSAEESQVEKTSEDLSTMKPTLENYSDSNTGAADAAGAHSILDKPQLIKREESEAVVKVKQEEAEEIRRESNLSSLPIKQEEDTPSLPFIKTESQTSSHKSSEQDDIVIKQEQGGGHHLFTFEQVPELKQEDNEEDTSGIADSSTADKEAGQTKNESQASYVSESESENADSDNEYSFGQEAHDHAAEIHTFRVDEKAVIPGPVKLVHSADNSLKFSPTPQQNPFIAAAKGNISSGLDSEEVQQNETESEHQDAAGYSASTDSVDSEEYKDSVEYSLKSLAPPRSPVRASHITPTPLEPASTAVGIKSLPSQQDFDSSVLANSSNISPPVNIKLPAVETGDNAFADLTDKLTSNSHSYEESLSAENDVEKRPVSFLSIWHSQSLGRRPEKPASNFYKVPSISTYNTADLSQCERYHIPASLQPKKFTDVNLLSTRVVSSTYEDLNVSAFLPELSQDSGLEDHFKHLVKDQTLADENSFTSRELGGPISRRKSLESSNYLSSHVRHGSRNSSMQASIAQRRKSIGNTLRPDQVPTSRKEAQTKISRFHVPSFEIKRLDSVLSPKNQYNEIFQDGSFVSPTIRAPGMKTLPSMDREDVKKIMQMKQAMSLEEYSGLKKVGAPISSTKHEQINKYDKLQQRASIYCDSLASTSGMAATKSHAQPKTLDQSIEFHPYVSAKLSAEKNYMNGSPKSNSNDSQSPFKKRKNSGGEESGTVVGQQASGMLQNSAIDTELTEVSSLPDPGENFVSLENSPLSNKVKESSLSNTFQDVETVNSSSKNPFHPRGYQGVLAPDAGYSTREALSNDISSTGALNKIKVKSWTDTSDGAPQTPEKRGKNSTRSSPIKINSPIKVVKHNGSVTGIVLDKKVKDIGQGQELHNKKLRTDKGHLSTISVPSNIMSDDSGLLEAAQPAPQSQEIEGLPTNQFQETGKLFFRVVGLKNVNVGELKDRNVSFNMTLDNGIHCIKTPNYHLESNKVQIDKEFELSVSDSLEFILTFKASYTKKKPTYKEVKERKVVKSKHKFGRLFGSKEIITTTKFVPQENTDPFESVFATDGSFARCYVDLDSFKPQITGQACNYDLICFNEWASYTHNGEKIVKQPHQIAQLEVKMLYVPRNETYEILPTSIKSAYESLDDLKHERSLALEGYLHQDGGDCDSRKRRWFKLSGTSLIAHSEYSHKTRAKINLAKVAEVIYVDRENPETSNHRNFSDILLMDNSFKIRFANGEIIDFGAPSKTEKNLWIKVIQEIVYRNKFRRQPWVKLMQDRNGDKRTSWIGS